MILTITLNASIDRTVIVEDFQTGRINRINNPVETAGGKGLNVTRALKAYNLESLATGFIGGNSGKKLEELLKSDNINSDFYQIKNETRSCLAIIDQKNNNLTEINENGPLISNEEIEGLYKKIDEISKNHKIAVISGSVPKSVSEDIYFDIIEICKKKNLLTLLDASGIHLKNGVGAHPYLVKPNQYEAEELLGFKIDSTDSYLKAIHFLTHYCQIAVVTLEDNGCIIGTKSEIYHIKPPKVKVVNTVGSGDSFLAGMIYAITKDLTLKEIGSFGIATGTANTLTDIAGLCHRYDIDNIIEKVEVERLL